MAKASIEGAKAGALHEITSCVQLSDICAVGIDLPNDAAKNAQDVDDAVRSHDIRELSAAEGRGAINTLAIPVDDFSGVCRGKCA